MPRAAVAVLLVTLVACGGGGGGRQGTRTARAVPTAPYDVATITEIFVDDDRPTPEPAPAPDRTLVTTIRYPDAPGPFPLIVLAHGLNGHPRKFTGLTTAWAEAGYVVAAPAFPLTNDTVPSGTNAGDFPNQPGDVSVVIDEVTRLGRRDRHVLSGRVDATRVGVAGLSLGAVTTFGVAFNSCCRDDRIAAAVTMAGARFGFDGAYDLSGTPLLVFHGDADPTLPIDGSIQAYAEARPPKFLVTIIGGGHAPPFEDTPDTADEMVTATTIDFWDRYLGGRRAALDALLDDAKVEGLTTLRYAR